ncbi:MAG TPA: NAD(P)-dependent oxidoreductase [Candidatus Omnitrophota bacterium]|nr:NAD(P)-dependent oxidoreductase [Candidatus Omnitrophota bacterium]
MKKVLVTGASGFIARNCLSPLVEEDYDVYAVALDQIEGAPESVKWIEADLLDEKQAEKTAKDVGATHLLHFAWYAEPKKYWSAEENFKWLEASKALLKYFYDSGGQRAVMAGTCAEYDWQHGCCDESGTPLLPATVYGKCKHFLQESMTTFSKKTGLSSAWGRIFFLYGPNEHPARLVPHVVTSILKGNPAFCSHGNQLRDFLYVKDVASAFVSLLNSDVQGAVNIASGEAIALKEVITKIGEKIGRSELIRLGAIPSSKDEPPMLVANIQRLTNEVRWAPGYDIDTGLDQTIEWWRNNLEKKVVH